ncbi:MAG: DNA polymerase I, partial [Anaerolineales bacterium]|nr:DNA polymerase I [Anaerolineales bacterium]
MPDSKQLVLIDGHALAYRAFHALPQDLRTAQGELTNAVFGFTSMLLSVLEDVNPEYIAVTFDAGPSFRHEMYTEYKAHRAKMPDEMQAQMGRIREIVAALSIPTFELSGFEADDLLGTLAAQAEAQGLDTLIVTGDADLLQLVNPRVRVLTSRWRFSDTVTYDPNGVLERYQLRPDQLADYKGLVGDKSDNIPGVAGVGEKTAVALLQQYGSLDAIYEHLDEIPARYRAKLAEGREQAFLSRRLGTIVRDAPIELDLQACRVHAFDRERVRELFRVLEFRSLMERLPEAKGTAPAGAPQQLSLFGGGAEVPQPTPPAQNRYEVIVGLEALHGLVSRLKDAPALTVDVETT